VRSLLLPGFQDPYKSVLLHVQFLQAAPASQQLLYRNTNQLQ
jgi:hypothetical protein